jgi:hypothetical protein
MTGPAGRHAVTSLSAGYGYLHHRYYDSSGLEYANNHSLGEQLGRGIVLTDPCAERCVGHGVA